MGSLNCTPIVLVIVTDFILLAQGPLRGNDAGVTSGGSLQCDFIIHILGPRTVEQAVERVKNVLKHCEDRWITSVSFPAIGTGNTLLDTSFKLIIIFTDFPNRFNFYSSGHPIRFELIIFNINQSVRDISFGSGYKLYCAVNCIRNPLTL